MSLVQALHYEITTPAPSLSHPAIPSPLHSIPQTPADDTQDPLNGPLQQSVAPTAGQPVFERAPSVQITQSRRLAITVLLLLYKVGQVSYPSIHRSSNAKVCQMTVSFAGIAGGTLLGESLGGQESSATWVGASYALVAAGATRYHLDNTNSVKNDTRDLRSDERAIGRRLRPSRAFACGRSMA